jgi:hypothetical protein
MTKSQSNPASRHDNDFIQSIVQQDIKEFKHVITEFKVLKQVSVVRVCKKCL